MCQPLSVQALGLIREREGRHLDHVLPRDAERLAARRQESYPGSFLQEDIRKHGDGIKEMLAVVDDDQRLPGGQVRQKE